MSPVSPSTSMMTGVRSSAAAALAAEPLTVMSNAAGVTVLDLDARQTVLEGGLTTRGIVTLSAAAPEGGADVALSSSGDQVRVPASITVAAGATTAEFDIRTVQVSGDRVLTITATADGVSRTRVMQLLPETRLSSLAIVPGQVTGGESATATVTLNRNAREAITVTLASANSDASVPSSVVIAAGSKTATFTITTKEVQHLEEPNISARIAGSSVHAAIRIVAKFKGGFIF